MKTLLDTIGKTPLIELKNLSVGNPAVRVFVKLEGQNPGGSVKDRVARYMIEQAEQRGELTPGKIILEATSGNMGIALAMVGAHKGYAVHIIMSEGMSEERKMMMRSFGAKLILTDKRLGTEGAIAKARELIAEHPDRYWFANQFNNPDNEQSHYHGIAQELLQELPQIDYLVGGMGTTGTMMGIARRFREETPHTKMIAVVPPAGYHIQGIQDQEQDFSGKLYDASLIDEFISVRKEDAFQMAKTLAEKEGLFVGMSSGVALSVALKKAREIEKGNIVAISADRGDKYLSTGLFA